MAREPRAQVSKVAEEESIQEATEEVDSNGERLMQTRKIDAEVDKDMVPKAQIKVIDAEAHPGPHARMTSLKRSRLPQNAVPRAPKLLRGATATAREGRSLLAEDALIQKGTAEVAVDGAPRALDQKVNAEAEQ